MIASKVSELDVPFETLRGCFGDSTNNDPGPVSRAGAAFMQLGVSVREPNFWRTDRPYFLH
jgi:hypothetical protein